MKVLFVCRASLQEGMGHLSRCQTMIENAPEGVETKLVILPDYIQAGYDVTVFDLNKLDQWTFDQFKKDFTVCLSPLFEHIDKVNQVFHRTRELPLSLSRRGGEVYAGLEYAVIGSHCRKISDEDYEQALMSVPFALSMTGNGLWEAMKYCSMVVCNTGVTPYEAVYAGIPSIIITKSETHYLVKELEMKGACLTLDSIDELPQLLPKVRPSLLRRMRRKCDGLIDNNGAKRIWDKIRR